jgi:plasmid stabilization system protein ParE
VRCNFSFTGADAEEAQRKEINYLRASFASLLKPTDAPSRRAEIINNLLRLPLK